MQEETKEEYLERHRREMGIIDAAENADEIPEKKPAALKEKLSAVFFMILFLLFLWVILQIFGMMKSN